MNNNKGEMIRRADGDTKCPHCKMDINYIEVYKYKHETDSGQDLWFSGYCSSCIPKTYSEAYKIWQLKK